MQKDNITKPYKGLNLDSAPYNQPKDTYRFALNAVNETDLGDLSILSNEESNQTFVKAILPNGFIPIGKVYIGDNEVAIFSVSRAGISEIGVYNTVTNNYVTHVNDEGVNDPLNFQVNKQIQAVYRLRRGCEKNIYWVDDFNKMRFYNFNKPANFKTAGEWDASTFELIRGYEKVPEFNEIQVLNSGGRLEAGSYSIAIQYLDDDLNPTEWVTTTDDVYIYNDSLTNAFSDINGSINSDSDYLAFPVTNKAIRVEVENLDTSFLYYRLAFVEANNGSGLISGVKYTENIPTSKKFFVYTGTNYVEEGTQEEIQAFSSLIDSAAYIEQVDNRLILANIKGPQINLCKLQQYASRVKADCIAKKVYLNYITDLANPKNPTHKLEGVGYMPGEMYSFGIVYVFSDGSTSPVYHIPGKSTAVDSSMTFTTGEEVYPMDNTNNSILSTYIDNSNCSNSNFWGVDSEGDTLVSKPIRHHRFPLRSEIGKPLVVIEESTESTIQYYNVQLRIQGDLVTPIEDEDPSYVFEVRVTYEVDGQEYTFTEEIDTATYEDGTGSYTIDLYENGKYHGSNNITVTAIEIEDENGDFQDYTSGWSPYFSSQPTITTDVVQYDSTVEDVVYSTEMLGIKFSGIEKPSIEDTNGKDVIGYYIVRNERTEFDKTILDNGVLIPTIENNKYISQGLLNPEFSDEDKTNRLVYGLIYPEHKFHDKKYTSFDKIIQQGNFDISDIKYGKINYDDVFDGSSYNSSKQKEGNDDGGGEDGSPTSRGYDGWSLNVISRDNITAYKSKSNFTITDNELDEVFYLDALESKAINDGANEVYNIAADNKICIVSLTEEVTTDNLPYVTLYRENLDLYSNFRNLPYYKDITNPVLFSEATPEEVSVFGGDAYVAPIRYVNTMFWDNRVAERKGKNSALKIILGAVIAVIGAVLTVFTAGTSSVLVAAGIAIIGGGALIASSGIKQAAYNKAYSDEYDKGLRETTLDDWVDRFYNYRSDIPFGFQGNGGYGKSGPSDDTIQWIGDCLSTIWIETSVNTNLRNGMISDVPTFLGAPGKIESGNDSPIGTWEFFGIYYTSSNSQRYPVSSLERHLARKLLVFDDERNDNRIYLGLPLGEYYNLNPDYGRKNNNKIYYHLPLEYDCCSECQETFPHRVHYSEQSFQEELTDNFRIFLPNNYRDIEGEKGKITNLYRLYNNLYIHTEEALWHLPQSYQERVTNDIISFIGTGSFFEVPPRRIVDSEDTSAGTEHSFGAIKTKYGIFFPSAKEGKVYLFNGNDLKPISDYGLSNWFQENMNMISEEQYFASNGRQFPYKNNPSNSQGSGYVSTYDSKKERFILTKKDFTLNPYLISLEDYELCTGENGDTIVFEDFQSTIDYYNSQGYEYVGIDSNCQMKFQIIKYEEQEEQRQISTTVSNTVDIHVFFDTSGSFDSTALDSIEQAVDDWVANFAINNPNWTGTLYKYNDASERWLNYAQTIGTTTYAGQNLANKDIIVISFCNEASPIYHGGFSTSIATPTSTFTSDYNNFVTLHGQYKSFIGIHYPTVFTSGSYESLTKGFLQHSLAALKGVEYTTAETAALEQNPGMDNTEWQELLTSLETSNPYPDNGLGNYGWLIKENVYRQTDGTVITSEQFQEDVTELLEGVTSVELVDVTILVPYTEYEYVPGNTLEGDLYNYKNSWTISYSMKNNSWVSWHSYIPNFYMHMANKFYSWIDGSNYMWKHNVGPGTYQTFYGQYNPHIIEYVSLSNNLVTRTWNSLKFITESKRYNSNTKQFYIVNDVTFNKGILYNSRQCTGELELKVKDTEDTNYLWNQIIDNNDNSIIVDFKEGDWNLNNLRDIRINYNDSIWNSDISSVQDEYYIDKVLNTPTLDINKDWSQLESFRDKYLVVRLIFDKFADVKLLTNYSVENEQQSFR